MSQRDERTMTTAGPGPRRAPRVARTSPRFAAAALAFVASMSTASSALAQPADAPEATSVPPTELIALGDHQAADRLDVYLERLGLTALQAEHMAARLDAAESDDERERLVERLARVYAALLESADSLDQQRRWERLAQDLLDEADGPAARELRLGLARAAYIRVEQDAEGWIIRVSTSAERGSALARLEELAGRLNDLAEDADGAVREYEEIEDRARGEAAEEAGARLSDARRQRSMAHYLAGWANYYAAELELDPQQAEDRARNALRHFGWLLNAEADAEPNLSTLPVETLTYEHVARSALAVPAALSLLARGGEALRWLDLIEDAPTLPRRVAEQLFARRLLVLARDRRWVELEDAVAERRTLDADTPSALAAEPLTVPEARLLAVLAFEGLNDDSARASLEHERIAALRDLAISDLAARGELGHVLDLAATLGFDRLGENTFVSHQVRGLVLYDDARQLHLDSDHADAQGPSAERPTDDPEARQAYRQAASQFAMAINSPDAGRFPAALAQTAMLRGLALYYAGFTDDPNQAGLLAAANGFLRAADAFDASQPRRAADALWMAIRSLDLQLEAMTEADQQAGAVRVDRDELIARFLRDHPAHERAAALLLRQALDDSLPADRRLALLLRVPESSSLYEDARRHAAHVAYEAFVGAPDADDFLASRYVEIAEPLLVLDRRRASAGDADAARRAALTARRVVEAVLAARVPDLARAQRTLDVIEGLISADLIPSDDLVSELNYRRAQIALARGDEAEAQRLLGRVEADDERFGPAARRLMYRDALVRWERARAAQRTVGDTTEDNQPDPAADDAALDAARRLAAVGRRLLIEFDAMPLEQRPDGVISVQLNTAHALRHLWNVERDAAARDEALMLYQRVLDAVPRSREALRGFAELAEDANRHREALDAWRTLLAAADRGADEWFRIRYRHARTLARVDRERARSILAQHRTLYPNWGPEPWGDRLRELADELGVQP